MSLLGNVKFKKRKRPREKDNEHSSRRQSGGDWLSKMVEVKEEEQAEKPVAEEVMKDPLKKFGVGLYDPKKQGETADEKPQPKMPTVGDGGASWRAKALKRARAAATAKGVELASVVQERWGSVEALQTNKRTARSNGAERSGASSSMRRPVARRNDDGDVPATDSHGDGWLARALGSQEDQSRVSDPIERRRLRIGRDARDRDLIGRFSNKLQAALGNVVKEQGAEYQAEAQRRPDRRHYSAASQGTEAAASSETTSLAALKSHGGKARDARDSERTRDTTQVRELADVNGHVESSQLPSKEMIDSAERSGASASKTPQAESERGTSSNKSAAAALRARLTLKASGLAKRSNAEEKSEALQPSTEASEKIVIAAIDADGRRLASLQNDPNDPARGGTVEKEDLRTSVRRKGKKAANTSWGQDKSLQELVEEEKSNKEGLDDAYARNIIRLGNRYAGSELGGHSRSGFDEEDQIDMRMLEGERDRLTLKARQERDKLRAVSAHISRIRSEQNCEFCMDADRTGQEASLSAFVRRNTGRRTVIASSHLLLVLPPSERRIHPEMCYILPREHIAASGHLDEDVQSEIVQVKAALRQLWANKEPPMGAIFFEAATHQKKRTKHAKIVAVPVPLDVEEDAHLYFTQEINSVSDDFKQNRKVHKLRSGKGIKGEIPPHFSHFWVEWGAFGEGLGIVIEDDDRFPKSFGEDVVGGMVGHLGFGGAKGDAEQETQEVHQFRASWRKIVGDFPGSG